MLAPRAGGCGYRPPAHDMKVLRSCSCGAIATTGSRCAKCQKLDDARRNDKRKRDGRNKAAWRRLRKVVIARDGGKCTRCGRTYPLSVHSLAGGYHILNADLYVTLCYSCHGSVDAPKASSRERPATASEAKESWANFESF